MIQAFAFLGLFVLNAASAAPPDVIDAVALSPLKPVLKRAAKGSKEVAALGKLSVTLTSTKDSKVVDQAEYDFGDCATCARGASITGLLGVRFEGKTLKSLRAVRKQTMDRVVLGECPETKLDHGTFDCQVIIDEREFRFHAVIANPK